MNIARSAAASPVATESSDLLELEAGAITLDEYVERRVELQVERFSKLLTSEELAEMREAMRIMVASDPAVLHYCELASKKRQS